ncbi:hypothetical protein Tco_0466602 [Tanacetum coccineum]
MILESVEHGPLIWPTIEENRVTRTKKYAELSATEKLQADCDMKEINTIFQGLPTEILFTCNSHRVAKDLWEKIQLLMQVNQQAHLAEFPQIDSGLAVPVFKQGDDPIDAINKMMSFMSTVVTSRFPSTNNQLRNSSNPRQQATIHDGRVNYLLETQNAAVQDTNSSAQQDAIILSMFEQLSNQVNNCNKVNKDNLIANESLSVELKRYKERVKLLEERQNVDLKISVDIIAMLYDGNVIGKETNVILIADSEETLMLEEESRSKMLLK